MADQIPLQSAYFMQGAANDLVRGLNNMVAQKQNEDIMLRRENLSKFGVLTQLGTKEDQRAYLEAFPFRKKRGFFKGGGTEPDVDKTSRILKGVPSLLEREDRRSKRTMKRQQDLALQTSKVFHDASLSNIKSRHPSTFTLDDGTIMKQEDLLDPSTRQAFINSIKVSGPTAKSTPIIKFLEELQNVPTQEQFRTAIMTGDENIVASLLSPTAYRNVNPLSRDEVEARLISDDPSMGIADIKAKTAKTEAEAIKAKRPQLRTVDQEYTHVSNIPSHLRTSEQDTFMEKYDSVKSVASDRLVFDKKKEAANVILEVLKLNSRTALGEDKIDIAKKRLIIMEDQTKAYLGRTQATKDIATLNAYSKQLIKARAMLDDATLKGFSDRDKARAKKAGEDEPTTAFDIVFKSIDDLQNKIEKLTERIDKKPDPLEDNLLSLEKTIRKAPSSLIVDEDDALLSDITDYLLGAEE